MGYIQSNQEKWQDVWFLGLSNDAKLLFDYLYHVCDKTGFYEFNPTFIKASVNIDNEKLQSCLKEIENKIVWSVDKKYIFLRNYLKHQRKTPLNPNANPHRQLIGMLVSKVKAFDSHPAIVDLIPISIMKKIETHISNKEEKLIVPKEKPTKRTVLKPFIKPTIEELKQFMGEYGVEKFDFTLDQTDFYCHEFYDHFESNGWLIGSAKTPMSDWRAASRRWLRRNSTEGKKHSSVQSNLFNTTIHYKDKKPIKLKQHYVLLFTETSKNDTFLQSINSFNYQT